MAKLRDTAIKPRQSDTNMTRGKRAESDATSDSLLHRSPNYHLDSMDGDSNDSPEDEFQETQQSKPAQELLSSMVVDVSSVLPSRDAGAALSRTMLIAHIGAQTS